MQMDWAIKEIDKRNPKHCLYIAFITAATYFAGGILSPGESYSAAWPNSRQTVSGRMPHLVLGGFTSQHRSCTQISRSALPEVAFLYPPCHSAIYDHALGYLVGPGLEENRRVDYSWFPSPVMKLPLLELNTHTMYDWLFTIDITYLT